MGKRVADMTPEQREAERERRRERRAAWTPEQREAKLERDRERSAADLVEGEDPDAARLAELVIALDEWLRRGGFLPVPWQR